MAIYTHVGEVIAKQSYYSMAVFSVFLKCLRFPTVRMRYGKNDSRANPEAGLNISAMEDQRAMARVNLTSSKESGCDSFYDEIEDRAHGRCLGLL